jgi:hypothetical protein
MNPHDIRRLGALLHSHSWRDSRDWANAVGALGELSQPEIELMAASLTAAPAAAASEPNAPLRHSQAGGR